MFLLAGRVECAVLAMFLFGNTAALHNRRRDPAFGVPTNEVKL